MAITDLDYGFYNSLNGDRTYNATDFTKIFDGVIQDGVFQTIGDHFQVVQDTGSNNVCKVKTGKAWLDHTYTVLNAIGTLEFSYVAVGGQSRIDAVVIEINTSERTNDIKIIEGTAASNPVKPSLVDPEHPEIKNYALAYVTIKQSEGSVVKDENIENNVGANNNTDETHPVLPYVIGAMQVMTPTQAVNQLEAAILSWFDDMKGQLSTDAAAHLQEELDDLISVGTEPLTSASQLGNGKIYLQYEE